MMSIKKIILPLAAFFCILACSAQGQTIRVIETSDVHGNYFPYDFIRHKDGIGSLARICSLVEQERSLLGKENVLLLDCGDILQGQPSSYYYNYVDTVATHVCADLLNFMQYDAGVVGNHDVETGHSVYDRWTTQCAHPVLAANAVCTDNGQPYWQPYTIIQKAGLRIAILGMITPTIPQWLSENLWSGIRFEDMIEVAKQYMPKLCEKADIVIGLFHSGVGNLQTDNDAETASTKLLENATRQVAYEVPGFDLILCGHDHRQANTQVVNKNGDTVRILNPGCNAEFVAEATISIDKTTKKKAISTEVLPLNSYEPSAKLMNFAREQYESVRSFTDEVIAHNDRHLSSNDAYFGSSDFVDFIHQFQLKRTGADISFSAPLSFNAQIPKGDVRVGDMFNLYPYENRLVVMSLTGKEIKDYLEYSYAGWTKQLGKGQPHLLNLRETIETLPQQDRWKLFVVPSYNFDSAAGILYTVDVTQPEGTKVSIKSMANGEPFDENKTYRVALNSYRANGGGRLLINGAGIPKEELQNRILWTSERDLRYDLMQDIKRAGKIKAKALHQWKFIPKKKVKKAAEIDKKLLFD